MNSNNININLNGNADNLDQLINKMKREDNRNRGMFKRMSILYFIMVFIYSGLLIVNPDKGITTAYRLSGVCYVLSFLIGGYYFWRYHLELGKLNYSESLLTVLKKAVNRYKLFNVRQIPMLFVIILIDIGITISHVANHEYKTLSKLEVILIIQGIYYLAMLISFFIGYFIWRKRSKPIYLESLKLIKELEN